MCKVSVEVSQVSLDYYIEMELGFPDGEGPTI